MDAVDGGGQIFPITVNKRCCFPSHGRYGTPSHLRGKTIKNNTDVIVHHQISLVDQQTCVINVDSLCLWCIVSGLGFLSLAPHQEARFLIPLLIPIVLVCARETSQASQSWQTNMCRMYSWKIFKWW